jgi:hypothetical protein
VNCRRARRLLSDQCNRPASALTPTQAAALAAHLHECAACARFARALHDGLASLHALPAVPASPRTRGAIAEMLAGPGGAPRLHTAWARARQGALALLGVLLLVAVAGLTALLFRPHAGTTLPDASDATPTRQRLAPLTLQPDEAVDLARFRGWHTDQADIAGVPQASAAFAAQLTAAQAYDFITQVEAPDHRQPLSGLGTSDTPVLFVVVRGPVSGGDDKILGDSLAIVFREDGRLVYASIGSPWDHVTPPGAGARPLHAAPQLTDVSRARAQQEFGTPLFDPRQVPAGLALQEININPAGTQVDPGLVPVRFSMESVTYIYADAAGRPRLWFTQTDALADFLAPPDAVPEPTDGRRYSGTWHDHPFVGVAWKRNTPSTQRWLYLSAELGADLTEAMVAETGAPLAATVPSTPTAVVPPTLTAAARPTWPVTVVMLPTPAYPWQVPVLPITGGDALGRVALLPDGAGAYALSGSFTMPQDGPYDWALARGDCAMLAATSTSPTNLLRQPATSVFTISVDSAWVTSPLAFVLERRDTDVPRACADLPVAAVQARQPSPETGTTAPIVPAPAWQVRGEARVWRLASGDFVLRVTVTGPAEQLARPNGDTNLIWFLSAGACNELTNVPGPSVLYRETSPVTSTGQQSFVLGILQQWRGQPLAVSAFVNGGGPFVACADLPAP